MAKVLVPVTNVFGSVQLATPLASLDKTYPDCSFPSTILILPFISNLVLASGVTSANTYTTIITNKNTITSSIIFYFYDLIFGVVIFYS